MTQPRLPRADRERQMLDVARRRFSERGFAAVSVDEIAEEVGVTKPMVYAYFGSKEGLFAAATEEAAAQLRKQVAAAARTDKPPDERIWEGLLAVFAFVDEHAEAWDLLYPSGPQAGGPFAGSAAKARDDMAELLSELFTEVAVEHGVDPDASLEAEPMGYAMTGATIALASWWRRQEEREPRELQALRLMNFVWQGLGALLRQELWLPPPEHSVILASQQGGAFAERVHAFRDAFLQDAFTRMPDYFRPERAGEHRCVVEWQITGRDDGGIDRWQVAIEDGCCTVQRDGTRNPDVRLCLDAVDFLELALGQVSGPQLALRGRLRVRGRVLLAVRMPGWFRTPTRPRA